MYRGVSCKNVYRMDIRCSWGTVGTAQHPACVHTFELHSAVLLVLLFVWINWIGC